MPKLDPRIRRRPIQRRRPTAQPSLDNLLRPRRSRPHPDAELMVVRGRHVDHGVDIREAVVGVGLDGAGGAEGLGSARNNQLSN
jgi:hypothetical protein